MKAAAKHWTLCSALWTSAIVLCASGCATHWHVAPKPVSATLEIQVQGQWQVVKREVYRYEAPMVSNNLQALPVAELERILRERESRGDFGAETTALRVLLERRKAGMKD